MKKLIIDIDNTLTIPNSGKYGSEDVDKEIVERMQWYHSKGFKIVLFTARNMRTYEGAVGLINKHTLPIILNWLDDNNIYYDEIIVGKPWCGDQGFYVDDRAIRPSEFNSLSFEEITTILENEKNRFNF